MCLSYIKHRIVTVEHWFNNKVTQGILWADAICDWLRTWITWEETVEFLIYSKLAIKRKYTNKQKDKRRKLSDICEIEMTVAKICYV